MCVQKHSKVPLLCNMRFSGFLKETPVCKKKTYHKNIQKSRAKGQKLAQSLQPRGGFFFLRRREVLKFLGRLCTQYWRFCYIEFFPPKFCCPSLPPLASKNKKEQKYFNICIQYWKNKKKGAEN